MSTQLGMFRDHYDPTAGTGSIRPIARNSDPQSSYEAARALKVSGKLGEECATALRLLRECTGPDAPTAREIAGEDFELRTMLRRRFADLREKGLVVNGEERVCRVAGTRAQTWRVVA
jgi:hypothetical protein